MASILDQFPGLRSLLKEVLTEVAQEMRAANQSDWIDQHDSELGPRRHAAAVKRRMEAGDPEATKVGDRKLLSAAAHAEELRRLGATPRPPVAATKEPDPDNAAVDRIQQRLRRVR